MSSAAPADAASPTLAEALWPPAAASETAAILTGLRSALLVLAGCLMLTVSAKVQVPFLPVPMTMQTFVVLVIGAAYGWKLGAATVLAYLVEGVCGIPVFAGPAAGPLYLLGPTGGFLIGFVPAAALVGYLAERGWDRPLARVAVLMILGHAVIFAFGLSWLAQAVGPAKAWAAGGAPFLLATALKTALAVAAVQAGWGFARR